MLALSGQVATVESLRPLFEFAGPDPAEQWTEVAVPLTDFIPTAFGSRAQGVERNGQHWWSAEKLAVR